MTTPHTPCAEAVEVIARLRFNRVRKYSPQWDDMTPEARVIILESLGGEIQDDLTAALPHLRRQIGEECVGEVAAMRGTWEHVGTPDPFYQAALVGVEMRLRTLLDAPTKEGE